MLVLIKKQLSIKTSASCTQNYDNAKIKQPNPKVDRTDCTLWPLLYPLKKVGLEVGFIPYRGDFDYEYDNSAEELIGEMEITENDSPQERGNEISFVFAYFLFRRIEIESFAIIRLQAEREGTAQEIFH